MFANYAKTTQIEQTPDKRIDENDFFLNFVVRIQNSNTAQN